MNQTIAKLDVAPSRQQKHGIAGQRVFTIVQEWGKIEMRIIGKRHRNSSLR